MTLDEYKKMKKSLSVRVKLGEDAKKRIGNAVYKKQIRHLQKLIRRGDAASFKISELLAVRRLGV